MTTHATDILDDIRAATESRDADALSALYADDARITIVDRSSPPSAPATVHGRREIDEYLREHCGREMTHRVGDEVRSGDRLAYTTACRYPDGTRVLCASVAHLDPGGRIDRQTIVQAWDE